MLSVWNDRIVNHTVHLFLLFLSSFFFTENSYQCARSQSFPHFFHFIRSPCAKYFNIFYQSSPNILQCNNSSFLSKYGNFFHCFDNYLQNLIPTSPWLPRSSVQTVISMQRPSSLAEKKKKERKNETNRSSTLLNRSNITIPVPFPFRDPRDNRYDISIVQKYILQGC